MGVLGAFEGVLEGFQVALVGDLGLGAGEVVGLQHGQGQFLEAFHHTLEGGASISDRPLKASRPWSEHLSNLHRAQSVTSVRVLALTRAPA